MNRCAKTNYQIVHFVNGKRTTTSTLKRNKKDAEKVLENFKNLDKNKNVSEININKESYPKISLIQFRDEYIRHSESTKSTEYVSSIKYSFNQIINFLGNTYIDQITLKQLDQFITSTFARTQRGAHLYYRTLKAAFTKAVSWNV